MKSNRQKHSQYSHSHPHHPNGYSSFSSSSSPKKRLMLVPPIFFLAIWNICCLLDASRTAGDWEISDKPSQRKATKAKTIQYPWISPEDAPITVKISDSSDEEEVKKKSRDNKNAKEKSRKQVKSQPPPQMVEKEINQVYGRGTNVTRYQDGQWVDGTVVKHYAKKKLYYIFWTDENKLDYVSEGPKMDVMVKDYKEKGETVSKSNATNATTTIPQYIPPFDKTSPIREWGCDLTETPLIFVHIGKAGGGSVKGRMAAAAHDYGTQRKKWNHYYQDDHYYPIPTNTTTSTTSNKNATTTFRRAKFCSNFYPHYLQMPHIQKPLLSKTYEGFRKCNATTPFGIAIACPHTYKQGIPTDYEKQGRGINYKHYHNEHCAMCDDDSYLDIDYYLPGEDPSDKWMRVHGQNMTEMAEEMLKRGFVVSQKSIDVVPPFDEKVLDPSSDPLPSHTCDIVYVGHNSLGNELSWLPPRYLKHHWWDQSEYGKSDELEQYWDGLLWDREIRRLELATRLINDTQLFTEVIQDNKEFSWCPQGYANSNGKNGTSLLYHRPRDILEYEDSYQTCAIPLAQDADEAFRKAFAKHSSFQSKSTNSKFNYASVYASLPLHRVTVMRDPWSWLVSKFFWHQLDKQLPERNDGKPNCYSVSQPTNRTKPLIHPLTGHKLGWVEHYSLLYLMRLCGNDCHTRYENGLLTLEELEEQAGDNLRNSFSVVGLLQEQDQFYDMVTDRIAYMDLSRNLHVKGKTHSTKRIEGSIRCKELFGTDENFRQYVRDSIPVLAALERIYHLAVRVNRFQANELKQCKLNKGQVPTKGNYTFQKLSKKAKD